MRSIALPFAIVLVVGLVLMPAPAAGRCPAADQVSYSARMVSSTERGITKMNDMVAKARVKVASMRAKDADDSKVRAYIAKNAASCARLAATIGKKIDSTESKGLRKLERYDSPGEYVQALNRTADDCRSALDEASADAGDALRAMEAPG